MVRRVLTGSDEHEGVSYYVSAFAMIPLQTLVIEGHSICVDPECDDP
jgi:hypothetical protein